MLPARTQTCTGAQQAPASAHTPCLQHQGRHRLQRPSHTPLASPAAFTSSTQPPSSWNSNGAAPAARQRRRARPRLSTVAQAAPKVGVFPAGQRQARVELPALMVEVDAQEVLDSDDVCEAINDAVTAGATAIVLGDARQSAAALYEAAVKLKELLRDRAALLLVDRTDIATAVKAEGVLLSDAGVPIVVARRMLQGGSTLVGRCVSSANDAAAAAADGANFVMLQAPGGELPQADEVSAARATQRSGNAIPVIASCSAAAAAEGLPPLTGTADGFSLPLSLLPAAAASLGAQWGVPTAVQIGTLLQALTADGRADGSSSGSDSSSSGSSNVAVDGSTLRRLMSAGRDALVADEKVLLGRVVGLLEEAAPQMEELGLLRDSLAALDDLFLVVVVGEFNSGKSTVINALLGERFLAEGILPTTNEISVLRHAEDGRVSLEQQADGMYVRRLPAELLKELNIVDTPGTNVILERQQRLTEEYVPRADLVLFVMSADRPFAESEVRFLEYIRQWRKKVVFVVNKVDMLSNEEEVKELTAFVSSNASRLLKLDDPHVLPISSRGALKAKLECGSATGSGVLSTMEDDLLVNHPSWRASRFGEFERFIYDFLVGGTSTSTSSSIDSATRAPPLSSARLSSGEGMRLKLQTPLFVGDALLQALSRQLAAEAEAARAELASVRAVRGQLTRFQNEMLKDGEAQRIACKGLVDEAISRSGKFIDKTLTLSNLPQLAAYVFGGSGAAAGLPVARGFDKEVAAGTVDQLAKQVGEHAGWLASNCTAQSEYYTDFLSRRRRPAGAPTERARSSLGNGTTADDETDNGREGGPAPPEASSSGRPWGGADESRGAEVAGRSLAAVGDFKLEAAKMLLEEEVREAFLGTAGTAAGAQGLGLLAANYLGSTVEDVLALAVAGLASYVAVLNLPLRRADIKGKVSKVARNYVDSVTETMHQELESSVSGTVDHVSSLVGPLEGEWQEELSRLESTAARCEALIEELGELERRTANMQ